MERSAHTAISGGGHGAPGRAAAVAAAVLGPPVWQGTGEQPTQSMVGSEIPFP
jgi:hypothetical protein